MKHRISLLSTTSIGVTLLWLAAASWASSAQAFDINDGEVAASNPAPVRLVRGRISLKPTPTQSSRKGLVFPRVYDDVEENPVPIAFAPAGSTTTVQAASNTMTVQAAPSVAAPAPVAAGYATLTPPAYTPPAPDAYTIAPDSYAAIAPAASAAYAPAAYVPAPVRQAASSTPAPVQTSTRIFNPLEVTPPSAAAACQPISVAAYPPVDPAVAARAQQLQAAAPAAAANTSYIATPPAFVAAPVATAPVAQPALGAPEQLSALPLAPAGPKASSARKSKTPGAVITPPDYATAQTAEAPQHEQLSRKTKSVLGTIPSKMDATKIEKTEKFDLSRTAASVDALDLKKAGKVDAYESAGIKISVRRPGLDTNYELNRAYNALTSGDIAAAMQTYKEILSVEPTNQDALFGLASLYHRQGDIAHARPLYAVLLKNYPTHREGINNFLVLVSDESPQEALAELERLEQRNPDFSPIPAQEAIVLERLGYSSEAQAKMIRAIELAPENLTYKYNLAIMMDRQQNYPQAIALYRLLLDSSSKGAQIPASADSIQRRLNHLATIVNGSAIPSVGSNS